MGSTPYNYSTFNKEMMEEDFDFHIGPEPGDFAPELDLPTVDGGRFRLQNLRGKQPVLLEFGSIT